MLCPQFVLLKKKKLISAALMLNELLFHFYISGILIHTFTLFSISVTFKSLNATFTRLYVCSMIVILFSFSAQAFTAHANQGLLC